MIYSKAFEIPANTPKNNLHTLRIVATVGILNRISLHFPPGCVGLVGVSLFQGGHQILPSRPGQFFVGNGETIIFDEWHELVNARNIITLKGYNLDEAFSHTVQVRFSVLKDWQVNPWISVEKFIKWIKIFMGRFGMG